ncbi:hypothetical protein [Halovivax limisalsi]|uniref:hypothetical protein n=1 Tax=Halovivax limisalsi TaxID=1453760 RepID=UPI001FFD979D|nr:hypothetical protein [Halovivax limisalsi]
MGRYEYDRPSPGRACERCGQELTDAHSVRLVAVHEGAHADRYRDVEKHVCGDCVAALGLLAFAEVEQSGGSIAERLEPVWTIGG